MIPFSLRALLGLLSPGDSAVLSQELVEHRPRIVQVRLTPARLDREVIRRVIRGYMPRIRYCYESKLIENFVWPGKITLHFTIAPDGRVHDMEVVSIGHDELEQCIGDELVRWRFPKPKGGAVIVSYPIILCGT